MRTGSALLMAWTLGVLGCATESQETSELAPLQASWSPSLGFSLTIPDDARLADAVKSLGLAGMGTSAVWVTGDGVSMPLGSSVESLSDTRVWPDVMVPTDLAVGSKLEVHTVNNTTDPTAPILGTFVMDLEVASRPSNDTPYALISYTNKTCYNYCNVGCNNCSACWRCGNNGYKYCNGVDHVVHVFVTSACNCKDCCGKCPVGTPSCGPYCNGTDGHKCFTSTVYMRCHN